MNRLIPFLLIYVLVNGSDGDHVRSYEGQSEETVASLLTSDRKTFEFISETEYKNYLEIHKPNPQPPVPDPVREQARIDLNNRTKTTTERVEAIIKYLGLDQPSIVTDQIRRN